MALQQLYYLYIFIQGIDVKKNDLKCYILAHEIQKKNLHLKR